MCAYWAVDQELVKGAGCIGPLFPDFRGWPLWFMASIALRGLQTPCTGGCSWRSLHSEALSPECGREHQETRERSGQLDM